MTCTFRMLAKEDVGVNCSVSSLIPKIRLRDCQSTVLCAPIFTQEPIAPRNILFEHALFGLGVTQLALATGRYNNFRDA